MGNIAWNRIGYKLDLTKNSNDKKNISYYWGLGYYNPSNKGSRYLTGLSTEIYYPELNNLPNRKNIQLYVNAFKSKGAKIWKNLSDSSKNLTWLSKPDFNKSNGYKLNNNYAIGPSSQLLDISNNIVSYSENKSMT